MKARMPACLAAAGLALACAAGCLGDGDPEWLSVSPSSAQGDVTLYRDVHFDDIPIPAEYQLLTRESHSFQSSLFREGVFRYFGPLEWSEALNFFRRELPARGWDLEKMEKGHDVRALYFRKGEERLIVSVRQLRTGSRAELQLSNIDKNDLLLRGRLQDQSKSRQWGY